MGKEGVREGEAFPSRRMPPLLAEAFRYGAVVSRVLFLLAKAMTISLDESLPTASSNLPEFQLARAAPGSLA